MVALCMHTCSNFFTKCIICNSFWTSHLVAAAPEQKINVPLILYQPFSLQVLVIWLNTIFNKEHPYYSCSLQRNTQDLTGQFHSLSEKQFLNVMELSPFILPYNTPCRKTNFFVIQSSTVLIPNLLLNAPVPLTQEVIPTFDMAANEIFFDRYPDSILEHQIQVRPYNALKTRNMRSLNPEGKVWNETWKFSNFFQ